MRLMQRRLSLRAGSVVFETGCIPEECLPFDRKNRLACRKHNGKRFTSLPYKYHIRYGLNPKKGEFV